MVDEAELSAPAAEVNDAMKSWQTAILAALAIRRFYLPYDLMIKRPGMVTVVLIMLRMRDLMYRLETPALPKNIVLKYIIKSILVSC